MLLVSMLATVSCNKQEGPVREAVSHKDDYQQTYVYGFPIIAAYKAMYEFAIDKSNSQYKAAVQHSMESQQDLYSERHRHRRTERRHTIFATGDRPSRGAAGYLRAEGGKEPLLRSTDL